MADLRNALMRRVNFARNSPDPHDRLIGIDPYNVRKSFPHAAKNRQPKHN